ncbi:MAG: prenyltransferase/squalene oxidase repeat-containing protein [Bryobacteraceae bacterium]
MEPDQGKGLQRGLERLLRSQNADGGWGYYAGSGSWMEPSAWAWIALQGVGEDRVAERAWDWMRSCQRSDGGVSPNRTVPGSSWVTSLWVSAHALAGRWDGNAGRALDWLLAAHGAEGALWRRWLESIRTVSGNNPDYFGWSWHPETSSWVEPTVHSVVALKLAGKLLGPGHGRAGEIAERVRLGEEMLLDRRCADGGWNYGASMALGEALPSYPECTGQAVFALQGRSVISAAAVAALTTRWNGVRSPMGRAWLRLGLRMHGIDWDEVVGGAQPISVHGRDVSVWALEAIAAAGGNHRLLRTAGPPKTAGLPPAVDLG